MFKSIKLWWERIKKEKEKRKMVNHTEKCRYDLNNAITTLASIDYDLAEAIHKKKMEEDRYTILIRRLRAEKEEMVKEIERLQTEYSVSYKRESGLSTNVIINKMDK